MFCFFKEIFFMNELQSTNGITENDELGRKLQEAAVDY
jgi:hypothetical protein